MAKKTCNLGIWIEEIHDFSCRSMISIVSEMSVFIDGHIFLLLSFGVGTCRASHVRHLCLFPALVVYLCGQVKCFLCSRCHTQGYYWLSGQQRGERGALRPVGFTTSSVFSAGAGGSPPQLSGLIPVTDRDYLSRGSTLSEAVVSQTISTSLISTGATVCV